MQTLALIGVSLNVGYAILVLLFILVAAKTIGFVPGGMALMHGISGRTTAPGAGLPNIVTMAEANSNVVKSPSGVPAGQPVGYILNMFNDNQVAGILRAHQSQMHDDTQGIRHRARVSLVYPLFASGQWQPIFANQNITFDLSGSAVAGDIENMAAINYYPQFGGSDQRLLDYFSVIQRQINVFTQEVNVTAGTGGGFTGTRAINADFDLMKAGYDYALLGIMTDAELCAVSISGQDTANTRIICPGMEDDKTVNREFFAKLSKSIGLPTIPVINQANRTNTTVEVVNDENVLSPNITLVMAQLRPV